MQKMTAQQVGYRKMEIIELGNKNKRPIIVSDNKKSKVENLQGQCKICGMFCECLTNRHAIMHGYNNKGEMIKDGMYKGVR